MSDFHRTRPIRFMCGGLRFAFVFALVFCLCSLLGACSVGDPSGNPGPEGSAGPTVTALPAQTPTPAHQVQRAAWQEGPHSDTYALEKGPNTYCARCHAPGNWDPTAYINDPPNCVSCKFAFEAEPRVAEGNPLVPEEEWMDIDCQVCHRMVNGVVQNGIAWLNNASGFHETVATSTDLCEKCHLDNETLRHARRLGDGAHADFVCTDCHDPHSGVASCSSCHAVELAGEPRLIPEHTAVEDNGACGECHLGAWESHPMHVQQAGDDNCMGCHGQLMGHQALSPIHYGHSLVHASLVCTACHDASGLAVDPLEGGSLWVTLRTTELLGRSNTDPYQSHYLQRSVDCTRCHFPENPWGLTEDVGVVIES